MSNQPRNTDPNARATRPGAPPPPAAGGGIPGDVDEDMTAPASPRSLATSGDDPGSDKAVIERAGELARAAQARGEDGQKVFEETLAKAGVTLPVREPPLCPPGYAMFRNTDPINTVKVTLLDGSNRPRTARVKPGGFEVFPIEYAHVIPNRAPQLVEVSRSATVADQP